MFIKYIIVSIICILGVSMESLYITFDRGMVTYVNREIVDANLSVSRINKTSKALSLYFELFYPSADKFDITMHWEIFQNNIYKKLPFKIKRNVCDALNTEYLWIKPVVQTIDSHYPESCPIKPGFYWIKDFVLGNRANLPPLFSCPWNHVKIMYDITHSAIKVVNVEVYITIDHDADIKAQGK